MCTECSRLRIASTAAWSAASLSPRPTSRAAASAAYSVTRTSSSARLRSSRVAGLVATDQRTPGGLRGRSVAEARMAEPASMRMAPKSARKMPNCSETSPLTVPGLSMNAL